MHVPCELTAQKYILYFLSSSDIISMSSLKATQYNLGGKVLTVGLNCAVRSRCSNSGSDTTSDDNYNGFNPLSILHVLA